MANILTSIEDVSDYLYARYPWINCMHHNKYRISSMACWLVKTEPTTYSIDHLASEKVTPWDGVRNYQARNYLRAMQPGDQVLIYHSVTDPIGVAGVGKVKKVAYPDPTQFEKRSQYYDEGATKEEPRWFCPDLGFVRRFDSVIDLKSLKKVPGLAKLELLKKGSRLSVMPVSDQEFNIILEMAG
jgi:predicted RNA-binding protein with PUA-like domain